MYTYPRFFLWRIITRRFLTLDEVSGAHHWASFFLTHRDQGSTLSLCIEKRYFAPHLRTILLSSFGCCPEWTGSCNVQRSKWYICP